MDNMQEIEGLIGAIDDEINLYEDYVSPKLKSLLNELYSTKEATNESIRQSVVVTLLQYVNQDRSYISIYAFSFLCKYELSKELLIRYLKYVIENTHLRANTKYFIYRQVEALVDDNKSTHIRFLLWKLLNQITNQFKSSSKVEQTKIPEKLRNENMIIIITDKFTDSADLTTLKALECGQAVISNLHKTVLLINTAEALSQVGSIEYYEPQLASYIEEKIYDQTVEWQGTQIPYFQCNNNMPEKGTIDTLIDTINKIKPLCVIDIGMGSVLANLAGDLVPIIDGSASVAEIMQDILELKQTKETILSICIPSYNRGHRALELIEKLIKLPKDLEVEFVVSNNGSIKNKEGYAQIKEYAKQDERIIYNEFEENQLFLGNFWKVILMANGKYAMLISDEDDVVTENLSEYIKMLKYNPTLGVVRTAGIGPYYCNEVETFGEAGDEAFRKFFLSNNYLSGIIYRTDFITEELSKEMNEKNKDNIAYLYYPHEFVDMYLCTNFDFCLYNVPLFKFGDAEPIAGDADIAYRNYESRLLQHVGFSDLLTQVHFQEIKTKVRAYMSLCWKTFFLLSLRKKYYPDNWNEVCDKCKQQCIDSIDQLKLGIIAEECKDEITNIITKYYNQLLSGDRIG